MVGENITKNLDLSTSEGQAISIIKTMDPEIGQIARLEFVNLPNEMPREKWIGTKNHTLYDTESFIKYLKKFGDLSKGIIYYNLHDDVTATCILDENQKSSITGYKDGVHLQLEKSSEYYMWLEILNTPQTQTHKDLYLFLKRNQNDIIKAGELLDCYKNIKTTIGMERLSEMDDGRNIGVIFKSKTGNDKESGRLISQFDIEIPILIDDDKKEKFSIDIHLNEPENTGEQTKFELICPQWNKIWYNRVRMEIDKIQTLLSDLLIVQGEACFQE